ncbi:hypothetical protein GCM10010191_19080 [Actinomadura vinacea]|uniref:Tn3 transposase DDE domain-containing protein n=1 Tax=Actinomadura vinacea TaxID=115336 RepID=A0ABN3IRF1_9ACTN
MIAYYRDVGEAMVPYMRERPLAMVRKAATLVYLANQACIESHVFLSRLDRLDRPDQRARDG